MNVLEVNNVKKYYRGFNLDVSFNLKENETIGFVGRNGAGKTTTMGIILNIIKKDNGDVFIFGKDHIKHEALVKEKMGVVLEDHSFYKEMKTNYILKFCASFYPNWDWQYVKYLRDKLQFIENKKYKDLSKGMKKKLFLIIALSCGAQFLLLDEPTSGLDPKVRNDILEEIEKVKKERTQSIFFSSHNMMDVEKLADRIILIENGKIVINDKKELLLKKWKKITFNTQKEIKFEPTSYIFSVSKINTNLYEIIVNNFSESILQDIKLKVGGDITISSLNLEQIFLQCVNQKGQKDLV
jgi:ABC-2 type transport system ATP-binding protein